MEKILEILENMSTIWGTPQKIKCITANLGHLEDSA
jgi:hypothetical protein